MKRILEIKLYEIVLAYIGLFALYVVSPIESVRKIVAPVMLILMAATFLVSLRYLKQR